MYFAVRFYFFFLFLRRTIDWLCVHKLFYYCHFYFSQLLLQSMFLCVQWKKCVLSHLVPLYILRWEHLELSRVWDHKNMQLALCKDLQRYLIPMIWETFFILNCSMCSLHIYSLCCFEKCYLQFSMVWPQQVLYWFFNLFVARTIANGQVQGCQTKGLMLQKNLMFNICWIQFDDG